MQMDAEGNALNVAGDTIDNGIEPTLEEQPRGDA